jgi:hypothetical protein
VQRLLNKQPVCKHKAGNLPYRCRLCYLYGIIQGLFSLFATLPVTYRAAKQHTMENNRDEELWQLAKKRARFKRHLTSYIVVIVFLWGVWWFTAGQYGIPTGPIPWPAWAMLGWGLGLAFHYFDAYGDGDLQTTTRREYEKLKAQQQQHRQS